jgi:SSS family solute:Na+ symporter
MAHAAGVKVSSNNDVVPALFKSLFSEWFVGFAFAAIAIGALVPAAVMSIGAANLFTRNFWKAYVNPQVTPAGEAQVAKITSLLVKVGALLCILFLPTHFALDLQLLGGMWILQTFPAVVFGLFTRFFHSTGLLMGWLVGFLGGTYIVWADGPKPLHAITIGGTTYSIYIGLLALLANVLVAVAISVILSMTSGRQQAELLQVPERTD